MPKIVNFDNQIKCVYCGNPAQYISVNTKKYRCENTITKCPDIINRAQKSREKLWEEKGQNAKINHMKIMSKNGNKTRTLQFENPEYTKAHAKTISELLIKRGGHGGTNNPMYGKTHTIESRIKQSNAKTPQQREMLSILATNRLRNGVQCLTNTKIELQFADFCKRMEIEFEQQFLIYQKREGKSFRHCYDFRITGTNILVEIDGLYWHSSEKAKARDLECEQVAKQEGFVVFRLTDKNITHTLRSLEGNS